MRALETCPLRLQQTLKLDLHALQYGCKALAVLPQERLPRLAA
jgi:hypothetical protein